MFIRAVIACICLLAATPAASGDVLLIAADFTPWTADVQQTLLDNGAGGVVDIFDARTGTPTLATLQAYDSVLVYSNYQFANRNTLGNALADYVDAGGGVVEAPFASNNSNFGLGGRWAAQDYSVWDQGSVLSGGNHSLGTVYDPSHRLLQGVGSFSGGSGSWRSNVGPLTTGSQLIADWSDGVSFAAFNLSRPGAVVGLNFFPPSSDARADFWDANSDGGRLLVNALNFAASPNSVPEAGGWLAITAFSLAGGAARLLRRRKAGVARTR